MTTRLTRDEVADWLDRYRAAWRSGDPGDIADLFSVDVRYEAEPYHVVTGRDAVIALWLADPDPPGTWEAAYEPAAIDGRLAVATGTSRYRAEAAQRTVFHNVFLLWFDDDGRCRHYREWYMREPASDHAG